MLKKKLNIKCLKCKRVIGSMSGFYHHWYKHHAKEGPYTGYWKKTSEKTAIQSGRLHQTPSINKKKVITPEMTFIDVPVLLRIPIIIGQAEISEETPNGNTG